MRTLLVGYGVMVLLIVGGCSSERTPVAKPQDAEKVKASKLIGMEMAQSIKPIQGELDAEVLASVIREQLAGAPAPLSEQEAGFVRAGLMKRMQEKREAEVAAVAATNLEAAQKFLATNKAKPGVKTTESGLQYQVLTEGKGKKPSKESRVKIHYTGMLIDGTTIDSSEGRGAPVELELSEVVPGWVEGLQLMQTGSKFRLWLPPHLGYGERGAGPIGPNALLVFDIELVEVTG